MMYLKKALRDTVITMYWIITLCCLLTVDTATAHDYRIFTYEDVHGDQSIKKFPPDGGTLTSEEPYAGGIPDDNDVIAADYDMLTLDIPRQQILIGARNALLRLDLSDLHQLERTEWPASNLTRKICQAKGKDQSSCQNYIRVLLVHKDRVFACGTNAFAPQCSWRQASDLSSVDEWVTGVAKAPYDPRYNGTALMTADGNLYSATVTDFKGRDPAICRIMGPSAHLRSVQHNNKWLHDPDFIATYEIEDFIYVFFREMALEYDHCGKSVYSRVARICKNDEGGTFLLEDNWTTFKKARLNCSLPGEYPFYFHQIEATYYDKESRKVYAVFTTGPNSIYASAICSFNMSGFHEAFRGPFTFQEDAKMVWTSVENSILPEHQQCGKHSRKRSMVSQKPHFRNLVDAGNYQMMHHSVQPDTTLPLAVSENQRWTQIVVDRVNAKHHESFEVLYVATREGALRKMAVLPGSNSLCLLEELQLVAPHLHQPITALELLSSQGVLFASTRHHVFRVPTQRCHRYTSRELCMKSQDPYCGWDDRSGQCTTRPSTPRPHHHWHQNITSCPILNYTVDGAWSPWGPWESCRHASGDHGDECRCRSRSCDRPAPANGGEECRGVSMEVTNCTVHGNWTSWSEWSACTSSCGTLSVRMRARKCGNPEPRFGGRVCVGNSRQEEYCGVPECPLPTASPVDGGWSPWSSWSRCSAVCDGGIQERHRECNQPVPNASGHHCTGNNFEWRMCNRHSCDEVRRSTEWTSWARVNESREGRVERRYKVVCKVNAPRQTDLRVQVKTNERFCAAGGDDDACAGENIGDFGASQGHKGHDFDKMNGDLYNQLPYHGGQSSHEGQDVGPQSHDLGETEGRNLGNNYQENGHKSNAGGPNTDPQTKFYNFHDLEDHDLVSEGDDLDFATIAPDLRPLLVLLAHSVCSSRLVARGDNNNTCCGVDTSRNETNVLSVPCNNCSAHSNHSKAPYNTTSQDVEVLDVDLSTTDSATRHTGESSQSVHNTTERPPFARTITPVMSEPSLSNPSVVVRVNHSLSSVLSGLLKNLTRTSTETPKPAESTKLHSNITTSPTSGPQVSKYQEIERCRNLLNNKTAEKLNKTGESSEKNREEIARSELSTENKCNCPQPPVTPPPPQPPLTPPPPRSHNSVFSGYCKCRNLGIYKTCRRCVIPTF